MKDRFDFDAFDRDIAACLDANEIIPTTDTTDEDADGAA